MSEFQLNQDIEALRKPYLVEKVVIVDGQPGCGKTMLSPIIAALDRTELLNYAYEIEYICALYYLKRIAPDAAETMIKMLTDLKLYNVMMSRDVNMRPKDLSSIFYDSNPWRYLKRLFEEGDRAVPKKIKDETHPESRQSFTYFHSFVSKQGSLKGITFLFIY